jgi:hypothetical protein
VGFGVLHTHVIAFYVEYDLCVDMHIHYDPCSLYVKYVRKRQGLSPGAIYQSAKQSTPLIMFILRDKMQVINSQL